MRIFIETVTIKRKLCLIAIPTFGNVIATYSAEISKIMEESLCQIIIV
ncbi:MAG: hypothetical protein IJ736_04265 [Firmicutes bacterium]|nr:hypothetical protein [Bacillota bacterium]